MTDFLPCKYFKICARIYFTREKIREATSTNPDLSHHVICPNTTSLYIQAVCSGKSRDTWRLKPVWIPCIHHYPFQGLLWVGGNPCRLESRGSFQALVIPALELCWPMTGPEAGCWRSCLIHPTPGSASLWRTHGRSCLGDYYDILIAASLRSGPLKMSSKCARFG